MSAKTGQVEVKQNLNKILWVPLKYAWSRSTLEEPLMSSSGIYYVCINWSNAFFEATLKPAILDKKLDKKGRVTFREDMTKNSIRVKAEALKRKYVVALLVEDANAALKEAFKFEQIKPEFISEEGHGRARKITGTRRIKRLSIR